MKILFISNIIGKGVGSFARASIFAAKGLGLEYHMAANFNNSSLEQMKIDEDEYGITLHHIDFVRNPTNPKNIKAIIQLIRLVKQEKFDIIHCNTPIGGLAGRLAGLICNTPKVIYQAHGFHFYKGAPLLNRTIYKWVEQLLAHFTDSIITINQEDYEVANSFHLRNSGRVYIVHGVGIDLSEFNSISEDCNIRSELGINDTDIVCISSGRLVKGKNYIVAIDAIARTNNSNVHLLICGEGPEKEALISKSKEMGIIDRVHFLGFRSDIKELISCSDIFLFTSLREGLSRSLMEAMAVGVPCVVSNIRGNVDLIKDKYGGYLCDVESPEQFAHSINKIIEDNSFYSMGHYNTQIIQDYSIDKVVEELISIYKSI